jgi:hypothetical protein
MPFGVWVDTLDDHVCAIGEEELQRLVGERRDELARVLPCVPATRRSRRRRCMTSAIAPIGRSGS